MNSYVPPKDSIGGTKAAAILGHSRYSSPFKAWLQLRSALNGNVEKKTVNEMMLRGALCEDPIVEINTDLIKRKTGLTPVRVWTSDGAIRHPKYDFIHATPDRLLVDENGDPKGILEVKTYDIRNGDFDWSRMDYACQQAHYKSVCENHYGLKLTKNFLLVSSGGYGRWAECVRLIRSINEHINGSLDATDLPLRWLQQKLFFELNSLSHEIRPAKRINNYSQQIEVLADWWSSYIVKDTPPPVDDSAECKAFYQQPSNRTLNLSINESYGKEIDPVLSRLQECVNLHKKEKEKEAKAKKLAETYRNEAQMICSQYGIKQADLGDFKIRFSNRKTGGRIDQERLRADHPELIEEYKTEVGSMLTMSITKANRKK